MNPVRRILDVLIISKKWDLFALLFYVQKSRVALSPVPGC